MSRLPYAWPPCSATTTRGSTHAAMVSDAYTLTAWKHRSQSPLEFASNVTFRLPNVEQRRLTE